MGNKNPYRYDRHLMRPCEANTGTFKCDIDTMRLKALGGESLSLIPEVGDSKPRRSLDDMRKLSEEIRRNRRVQKQITDDPSSKKSD